MVHIQTKLFKILTFKLIVLILVGFSKANLVLSKSKSKLTGLPKNVKVNQMDLSEEHEFIIKPESESSTGLEFLEGGFKPNLNIPLFIDNDPNDIQRRTNLSAIGFVQMFIKNVKGVDIFEEYDDPFLSGTHSKRKPEWCFYPFKLKELVKVEQNIYEAFVKMFPKKSNYAVLESYLIDIEESLLIALDNVEAGIGGAKIDDDPYLYVASHPILVYRMIRRFVEDLPVILSELQDYDDELIEEMLLIEDINPDGLVFPVYKDLNDALEAINRMQRGNNLNTFEIGNGVLENVFTGIGLNALQMLELGALYLDRGDFDHAIQWLHLAFEKVNESKLGQKYPEVITVFEKMLKTAIMEHNQHFSIRLKSNWNPRIFSEIVDFPFEPNKYIRKEDELKELAIKNRKNTEWNWPLESNYRRVCSGENLQTEKEKAKIKCWYDTFRNPYWKINPLKTELLSKVPEVYQFYDVIGDNLIDKMKESVINELKRSEVVNTSDPVATTVGNERTSTQTWLDEEFVENSFLLPLSKRFEMLSGLNILRTNASDPYQVAVYGPSHHYEAHLDAFENPGRIENRGNRITTIMGYLSDVTVGGRTGFPVLGIAAEPVKGSVVMWDNLMRNGQDRDDRTYHGGCPVSLGIKWITNKWIYYKENPFSFQCSLNANE